MIYIIEGINSEGELITTRFIRVMRETVEQSAKWAAMYGGISGAYSWYEEK